MAALVINYVFGAALFPASWKRGLRPLWDAFWEQYLRGAGAEVLEVIAPFFAWRALVVASPVWYPDLTSETRSALLSFAEDALESPPFDPGSLAKRLS